MSFPGCPFGLDLCRCSDPEREKITELQLKVINI